MERKEKEYDRARSFEQQNVPKASLPSPSFLTILHGGGRKKAFEGEGEKGGGRGRFVVEASWSGSELPLSVKL